MINHRIKELRKQRRLSQQELATMLHLSRKTVSNWETGSLSPSVKNTVELTKVFCVNADYLLGISDDLAYRLDTLPQKEQKRIRMVIQAFSSSQEEAEQESL